ncbi:MAG TPA: iron-containing alcohol dehydrogenase [Phycisphaerae bacterium]
MKSQITHTITSLESLIDDALQCKSDCACGRRHAVPTKLIRLDDAGGAGVAAAIRCATRETDPEMHPTGRPVLLVADSQTYAAHAGSIARELARSYARPKTVVFATGPTGAAPHAPITADIVPRRAAAAGPLVPDEWAIQQVLDAFGVAPGSRSVVIAVGSGTITDICKVAADKLDAAYIVCPTAASMNGYTSTIAALKRGGLKVTDSVTGVDAVVVDMEVIVNSPPDMTAAGVADLLSKFVCHADWTIAHLLDGGYYCTVPSELASRATEAVIEHLDAIAARDRDGLTVLMQALLLSGLAMAMAGSSSPASGGEHLISHYWDMICPHTGGRRYHGTQVGIGILISAALYERLRRIDPRTIHPQRIAEQVEDWTVRERALRAHFGHAAEAVIEQARAKHLPPDRAAARAAQIAAHWDEIWRKVDPILKTVREVRDWLRRCGAPTTASELGISAGQALDAVRWARHLRNRFTVFDFAAQIGAWTPPDQGEVLQASGVLR